MRRTLRASACGSLACGVSARRFGMVLDGTPRTRQANPQPGDRRARRRRRQRQPEAAGPRRGIQTQQESVNKAIVDVQTARDNAATAQQRGRASQRRVKDANAAIAAAQQRFDTFAASTYINGPSGSYLTATDPADILDTAAAGQTLSVSSAAGDRQPAAGPHRAGQQGVRGAAGQAEGRSGRRRRADQPGRRRRGADPGAADVQATSRPNSTGSPPSARPPRRNSTQARAVVGAGRQRQRRSAPQPRHAPSRGGRPAGPTGTATPPRQRRGNRQVGHRSGTRPCPRSPARSSAATRSRSSTRSSGSHRPRRRSPSRWAASFLQKLGLLPTADAASPTARSRASTAGRPPST